MTLRRYAPLALMALAVGCTEVKQEKPTNTLVFATFDSTAGVIPTPNDLALQALQKPHLPGRARRRTCSSTSSRRAGSRPIRRSRSASRSAR